MAQPSMRTRLRGSALLPTMVDGERTARQRLQGHQQDFADRLIRARQSRGVFSDFENHPGRPGTLSDGYGIQATVVDGLASRLVGIKAGLTTPEAMRAFGLSSPVFAPILAGSVVDAVPNKPVTVALPEGGLVYETEIGFVTGAEGEPAGCLVIELARPSYGLDATPAAPDIAADLAGAYQFVRGPLLPADQGAPVLSLTVGEGELQALAVPKRTDLLRIRSGMLQHLANWFGHAVVCQAGLLLATGSVHVPIEVRASQRCRIAMDDRVVLDLVLQ